jgi:two-component system CheB/CheR fusion protein
MQPLRILVVEDLHDSAETSAHLLRLWGYQTAIACNGERALEEAKTFHPDVVLLDIGLPGMDGYELARRLRQMEETAKALLVAITGYGQADDVKRSKEAGIDYHFLKPVDHAQLRKVLSQTQPQR